jgi:uncharacterized protein YjbI with pentapeptide repeats
MVLTLTKKQIQWFRNRWDRQLINQIVTALNDGEPIHQLVKDVIKDKDLPEYPEKLDLRGIDFSHQNLRGPWDIRNEKRIRIGVNLQRVDLTGADLSWALLPRSNLNESILLKTDLRNAELIYASLEKTELTDALMNGAWLLYTRFHGSNVTEQQLESRRNLEQMDFDYHAYEK